MAIFVPNAIASIVFTVLQYSRCPHFLEIFTICFGVSGLRLRVFFTVVIDERLVAYGAVAPVCQRWKGREMISDALTHVSV